MGVRPDTMLHSIQHLSNIRGTEQKRKSQGWIASYAQPNKTGLGGRKKEKVGPFEFLRSFRLLLD
jgi:hypothetical protein